DVAVILQREVREHQFGETIGLFEMRIAGQDESIDADILIFLDPRRHRFGITHQSGAGPAAYETNAGPQVRADLELVAPAAMQLRHALLTDRIHAREDRSEER